MSLSAKFAQLKSAPKPAGKDGRKANQIAASKDKRAAATAAKRGITLPGKKNGGAPNKGKTQIKRVNVKGKPNRPASAGGKKGAGAAPGKGPRGKGKGKIKIKSRQTNEERPKFLKVYCAFFILIYSWQRPQGQRRKKARRKTKTCYRGRP
jgi:hypothetical protein